MLPNAEVHLSEKGWINKDLFLEWFRFCIGDNTRPILLLMDSHGSHITPEIIDLAHENGMYILTFPAHTTHILQPLDVGVYKALKSGWQQELSQYMQDYPTEKPTKQNFHSIFNVPFIRAMSSKNIKNSFWACGIAPLNREAVPKEKLAPSLLTERPLSNLPAVENAERTLQEEYGRLTVAVRSEESNLDSILKLLVVAEKASSKSTKIPNKRGASSAKLLTPLPGPSCSSVTKAQGPKPSAQCANIKKSFQQNHSNTDSRPGSSK